MRFVLLLILLTSPLLAERFTIDPSARNFEMQPPQKLRVDTFDFAGEFPQLENIDINARKKKNVEFILTGDYPVLEAINYEGTFGSLKGQLTGNFPNLSLVNFLCTSCAMQLNLNGGWKKSCDITIRGADENITLNLPKDVGLIIHTKTGLRGKVSVCEDLKKKGWYKIINKTYQNPLAETSPIVLTIHVETVDGNIILN